MAEAPPKKPPVERRSGMFRDMTPDELAARGQPAPLSGPTKIGADPVLKMPPAAKKAIALKALATAPKPKQKAKK